MNEAIICRPIPAKTLAITEAVYRELSNFLIYKNNSEILNERARKQPSIFLPKLPTNVREIGIVLGAKKCEKGRKLYFDYADSERHRGILIHNFNAQFWVHYFRSGIGLVSVTCFSQLASAEGSVLPLESRTIDGSYEYQWFTHNLSEKYFQKGRSELYLNKLSKYFIQQVNPKLVSPYSVFSEEKKEINPAE